MILNNIAIANRRLFRIRLNKNIEFNKTWHDIILFRMYLNYIILILWHDIILYILIINKNFGTILFKTLHLYINIAYIINLYVNVKIIDLKISKLHYLL